LSDHKLIATRTVGAALAGRDIDKLTEYDLDGFKKLYKTGSKAETTEQSYNYLLGVSAPAFTSPSSASESLSLSPSMSSCMGFLLWA
jgi:hypothetical protein